MLENKPKRPRIYNKEVVKVAASAVFPAIKKWLKSPLIDEESEDFEELCKAIEYDTDAYEIAKYLEDNFSWDADESLVYDLGSVSGKLSAAHKNALAKWVMDNGLTAPFEAGQSVKCKKGVGEIVKNTLEGQSLVFIESLGHVRHGLGTHGVFFNWEELSGVDVL